MMKVLCFFILIIGTLMPSFAMDVDSSRVDSCLDALARNPDDKEALCTIAFHNHNLGNNKEARKYGRRLLELGEQEHDREYSEMYGHLILGLTALSRIKVWNAIPIWRQRGR